MGVEEDFWPIFEFFSSMSKKKTINNLEKRKILSIFAVPFYSV